MPNPGDNAAPQKKKKACRTCLHRIQRCDFEEPCHNCEAQELTFLPSPEINFPQTFNFRERTSADAERMWNWQPTQTPAVFGGRDEGRLLDDQGGHNHSSPPDLTAQALSANPRMAANLPSQSVSTKAEGVDEPPTATTVSSFRI
jgi:hypothetical protein